MSSYVNFFVKKDNVFCPIGSFSRNTPIYYAFNHLLPYEKCKPIKKETIDSARMEVKQKENYYKRCIDEMKEMKEDILQGVAPLADKIECISDIAKDVEVCKTEVKSYKRARYYIDFLQDIIEEAEYSEMDLDYDDYLYGGIECYEPTVDDIDK